MSLASHRAAGGLKLRLSSAVVAPIEQRKGRAECPEDRVDELARSVEERRASGPDRLNKVRRKVIWALLGVRARRASAGWGGLGRRYAIDTVECFKGDCGRACLANGRGSLGGLVSREGLRRNLRRYSGRQEAARCALPGVRLGKVGAESRVAPDCRLRKSAARGGTRVGFRSPADPKGGRSTISYLHARVVCELRNDLPRDALTSSLCGTTWRVIGSATRRACLVSQSMPQRPEAVRKSSARTLNFVNCDSASIIIDADCSVTDDTDDDTCDSVSLSYGLRPGRENLIELGTPRVRFGRCWL